MLVVVGKVAVDEAAFAQSFPVAPPEPRAQLLVVRGVLFGGVEVIAFIAGKAFAATGQLQDQAGEKPQRDRYRDIDAPGRSRAGQLTHRRSSPWSPRK